MLLCCANYNKDIGINWLLPEIKLLLQKKRKVTDKGWIFKEQQTSNYFSTYSNSKPMCLICKESLSVLKEYNLKCRYETKHKGQYNCFIAQLRNDKTNSLKSSLCQQQNAFQRHCNENKSGICASYRVVKQLVKENLSHMVNFSNHASQQLFRNSALRKLSYFKTQVFQRIQ
jgi:hypothetical protein